MFIRYTIVSSSKKFLFREDGGDKVLMIETNFTSNTDQHFARAASTTICKPHERIMFLKTHKTGSSTITNILNRFGNKRNLSFALPTNRISFAWPNRFRTNTMIPLYSNPHILCNHARYSKPSLHHIFPKESSKYITILRDPVQQYESIYVYMKLWEGLNIHGGGNHVLMLDRYLQNVTDTKSAKMDAKLGSRLLRNPLLFDLGLDFRYYQDLNAVWNYISFLEKEFDLVMIMEYFDESVVLLKRLLCWELEDVVFFKLNERLEKDKRNFTERIEENIRSWNQADLMLYKHFNKTFWKKIAEQGADFYEDLAQFREKQREVFHLCVESTATAKAYTGKFVKGYRIRTHLSSQTFQYCTNIIKGELDFIEENIAVQKRRQELIDHPGEFEDIFDKENDWSKSKDLLHHPLLSPINDTKEDMNSPAENTER